MRMTSVFRLASLCGLAVAAACGTEEPAPVPELTPSVDVERRLARYATVTLTADITHLARSDQEAVALLMEAAEHMTPPFWVQAYGDPEPFLASIPDRSARRFAELNYGPWDRLAEDEPFLVGIGPKPPGANLYPTDMTVEEFERAAAAAPDGGEALRSLYTLVRRGPDGSLMAVPYHQAFAEHHRAAATKLEEAAALVTDPGLKRYLALRARALLTDDYRESDLAWMDMKDTPIDVVIGPIETYEDGLFGYKAGHEAYVLIKDMEWSRRLARFADLLPGLQMGLPVPEAYKREMPGAGAELNAYDAVFYAGEANTGAKTIAINLPNDEEVQLAKGTRRIQIKNVMRAKFDVILSPLSKRLVAEDQREHVTFDAFFQNVMFHEVAHGLGIKNTIDGRGTVRAALREHHSALEEGKADILGLYMLTRLFETGEMTQGTLEDNYVTFMASIFRSVRFGATDAHGRANMAQFNYFLERGAFSRDPETGTYRVAFEPMREAMTSMAELILVLQGDGAYDRAGEFLSEQGVVGPQLQADLEQLGRLAIPVDLVFDQGVQKLRTGETTESSG